MTVHITRVHCTRALAVLGVAATSTLGFGVAGAEARVPKPVLQVDGGTSYTINGAGDAVVTGPAEVEFRHTGILPATITATLSPDDGTLPEPETCEPATAKFIVTGDAGRVDMRLRGKGEVCGEFPQPPTSIVTHVFTGRYHVIDARRDALLGTNGFFEVRLATDNLASAFAIDT
jgi:hypothetical protein